MTKYAVTFQLKYNHDDNVHPLIPEATGHSFLVIEANDYAHAHTVAFKKLGQNWAFLYPLDSHFKKQVEQFDLHEVTLP